MSEAEVSGWAPKSFMSREGSHEVGGDGAEDSVGLGTTSQENGDDGEDEPGLASLSVRVMIKDSDEISAGTVHI